MPTPKESLLSIHQILHLTHHRNKNQHRLSKWYKPFSQLRRQVAKLISEVEALQIAERFSSSGGKGKGKSGKGRWEGENKYVVAAREKVEARARFLGEWVVGDCFLAFSNLVADNQYSVLGLMLLGTLARLKSILRQLMGDEDQEVTVDIKAANETAREALSEQDDAHGDDFGEVVRREDILVDVEGSRDDLHEEEEDEVAEHEPPGKQEEQETKEETKKTTMARSWKKKPWIDRDERLAKEESTPSKPPKKKRKKGDAFDALFDSLI